MDCEVCVDEGHLEGWGMVVGAYMGWECYVYNLQGMHSNQGQVESAGECACSDTCRHSTVPGEGQEAVSSVWLNWLWRHTVYVSLPFCVEIMQAISLLLWN